MRSASSLPDFEKLTREVRKQRRSPGCQMHVILDPYATPPRPVDPRLDRHHGILRQDAVRRARQPGGFMHLEAEAVAKAVTELLPVTAPLNVVAGEGIGIPPAHSGPHGRGGNLVGPADDVIDLPLLPT